MSLNIKLTITGIFIYAFCFAQNDTLPANQYIAEDPETVFFHAEFFRPVSINDSFWGEYNTYGGFALDFNWFVIPELTLGTHYSVFGGRVENRENTGNISGTTTNLLGINVGYYHAFNRELSLHTTAGLGVVYYTNRAPEDKFTEEGDATWLQSELAFRFDRTMAVYVKAATRWDRMDIKAPRELEDYFNKHSLLILGFGLRIHFQNPGG
ncbi:hypothetical protein [Autumnicola musiva]|uniref:Outer membrane protein beta-barrel domain-containing protein n=1 Tax=Autumnicola musiva TaxID=3075589 RepID=A0ABU3D1B2_9FLAO|nr:hypothetical protein [Zunongwangia sp. F117]MDT0675328.1 hypothetical protein [Zunongwangia sp. F117]